ncbi:stage II sporulation protein M [Bowmanella denitrificans]|uniref:stage II sporulation protein M n=1 Tax=Bowmanella denitrificans TaxID=366582 RepID=UPI0011AFCC9B|nr:stage II sporulation protein M [Bowmanella denitrificans]
MSSNPQQTTDGAQRSVTRQITSERIFLWLKNNALWSGICLVCVWSAYFLVYRSLIDGLNVHHSTWLFHLLPLLVAVITLGIIYLATADLIIDKNGHIPVKQLNINRGLMGLAYMYLILWACVLVFLLLNTQPLVFEAEDESECYQKNIIAVIPGCDFSLPESIDTTEGKTDRMPNGAEYCGDIPPQWVLVLGGMILDCQVDGTCRSQLSCPSEKRQVSKQAANCHNALDRLFGQQDNAVCADTSFAELQLLQGQLQKKRQRLHNQKQCLSIGNGPDICGQPTLDLTRKDISRIDELLESISLQLAQAKVNEMLDKNLPGAPVLGGVVVPIYFIALAIFGALVAMARKLPEFQSRLDANYSETYEDDLASNLSKDQPLNPSQLPELLVFQVVQVICAPVIAIVAYALVDPEQLYVGVVTAFAVGFSSEWVLLLIRNVTDKLGAAAPRGPRIRKIREKAEQQLAIAVDSIQLPSGEARVGDRVVLVQPVNQYMIGSEFVITSIKVDAITVREVDGKATLSKAPHFFDLKVIQTEYVSLTQPNG